MNNINNLLQDFDENGYLIIPPEEILTKQDLNTSKADHWINE